MSVYLPFKGAPSAAIAVELVHETQTVELHSHAYQEFVLVLDGACKHRYNDREVPLLPGDIFLVPAHRPHSYIIENAITLYNVQFFPVLLEERWGPLWRGDSQDGAGNPIDALLPDSAAYPAADDVSDLPLSASLNQFGILRLNQNEAGYVTALLSQMYREQQDALPNHERALRAYLEILLVIFSRVRARQLSVSEEFTSTKKTLVKDAILYIENHLSDSISFSEIAAQSYLSPNYFRTLFKEATGLSPVDYLNRLRITTSLDYIRKSGVTIAEAAAMVGINDPNYFSRLFKKIIGYPPSQLKHIGD